jgi:hypothetical protein
MIDLNTLFSNALTAAITNAVAPLNERIAALESANDILHRVQHEDMVAMRDRIAALETKLTEAALFTQTSNVTIPIDEAKMVEALNSQEWFWEKLQNRIDSTVEAGIDDHCQNYDHDSYDNAVSDLEDRDFVTNDSLEDAVREAVGNLSFDISVS